MGRLVVAYRWSAVLKNLDQLEPNLFQVGLGVKPGTSVETLVPFIEHIDTALIMTVEPGFGGQKFMADMMKKVRRSRSLIGREAVGWF